MKKPPVISVIGEAQASKINYKLAEEVGRLIAKSGAVLVCGGMGGVMEAAAKGAYEAGGVTVGVLPVSQRSGANPYIIIPIPTGMWIARNIIVVLSGQAAIAIGGRYGTLTEIGYALHCGKPVIGLNTWRMKSDTHKYDEIHRVKTAKDAVTAALRLIKENKS